jgi:hypothetical protein
MVARKRKADTRCYIALSHANMRHASFADIFVALPAWLTLTVGIFRLLLL